MNAMFCVIKLAVSDNHSSMALVQWNTGYYGVVFWENRHYASPRTAFEWRTEEQLSKFEAREEFGRLAEAAIDDTAITYLCSRVLGRYDNCHHTPYKSWLTVLSDSRETVML